MVLFIVANANSIMFVASITFSDQHKSTYHNLLSKFINQHLSRTTDLTKEFPSESFTEKGLSQNGYHIDKDAIEIQFGLWKQLNKIVDKKKDHSQDAHKLFLEL